MKFKYLAISSLALSLAACGTDEDPGTKAPGTDRCETAEYVAFDAVNHEPQDRRLEAMDEMLAHFAAAQAAPATAADAADAIRVIYTSSATNLQAKVQGRKDVHFVDDAAMVGPAIDAALTGAIDALAVATTPLEVALAKQTFEKSGLYHFLYLSVMQELYEPSKKHYDEAWGYFGSGHTNTAAGRKSLARLSGKRDGDNETTLANEIFALLLDGKCALAAALEAAGTDSMAMGDDAAYDAIVETIDARLQLVIAYSIGHELVGIEAGKDNAETATIKLWEADGFFDVVEAYLASGDEQEKAFAAAFRTAIDDAMAKAAAGDTSWIGSFDAQGFLGSIEAIYGIDVKG